MAHCLHKYYVCDCNRFGHSSAATAVALGLVRVCVDWLQLIYGWAGSWYNATLQQQRASRYMERAVQAEHRLHRRLKRQFWQRFVQWMHERPLL